MAKFKLYIQLKTILGQPVTSTFEIDDEELDGLAEDAVISLSEDWWVRPEQESEL